MRKKMGAVPAMPVVDGAPELPPFYPGDLRVAHAHAHCPSMSRPSMPVLARPQSMSTSGQLAGGIEAAFQPFRLVGDGAAVGRGSEVLLRPLLLLLLLLLLDPCPEVGGRLAAKQQPHHRHGTRRRDSIRLGGHHLPNGWGLASWPPGTTVPHVCLQQLPGSRLDSSGSQLDVGQVKPRSQQPGTGQS